jgi:cytochrome c biogenesis factor
MVIHPPTLFLGFASMIVPFAYATGALGPSDTKNGSMQHFLGLYLP